MILVSPVNDCASGPGLATDDVLDAMNEVGWCYLEGFGCKKDKVRNFPYETRSFFVNFET